MHLGFWNSTKERRSENKQATCNNGQERKRDCDPRVKGSPLESLNTQAAFGKLPFKGPPCMVTVYLHKKLQVEANGQDLTSRTKEYLSKFKV